MSGCYWILQTRQQQSPVTTATRSPKQSHKFKTQKPKVAPEKRAKKCLFIFLCFLDFLSAGQG
jgi:hypothetical protein